jgi:glycosyltransferase involved in cell wall biosynthesis
VQILAATLNYPPARFIGSEMMTHRLLLELAAHGHDVLVLVSEGDPESAWEYEGIRIQHRTAPRPRADLVICHTDFANRALAIARHSGAPLVGICHNAELGVQHNLDRIPFAAVIVNSESMKAQLGAEGALVVNPPMRDHRQPAREQGRPVLADSSPAA